MAENSEKIDQLLAQLEVLLKRQESFSIEVNEIKDEIQKLKIVEITKQFINKQNIHSEEKVVEDKKEIAKEEHKVENQIPREPFVNIQPSYSAQVTNEPSDVKDNIEKFIGENLINKVGIAITVIGVAIGAKYSVEHQLISPLTRILLGYVMGLSLLGFGLKLKTNYENYSSVLVSGAMAIMYFITYLAYSLYNLMPQSFAFLLMVVFTVFTVYLALKYNKQVIAHIGLVGAYAVPFLLSDGSGKVAILFSYMAIINIGILVIGFKKYWKFLYYSAFLLTWIIFVSWFVSKYNYASHFELASSFLAVFFAIFYSIFLAYKLIQKEKFEIQDIILLLSNSFIFYGMGYAILDDQESGKQVLGLYTLCNALIHSVVGFVIYRQKHADTNMFYFISGLALVFVTIAVPIHLDGNWVTLLWAGEAALLFWIGRTKNIDAYEILSYPLMLLAFISIIIDWATVYNFMSIGNHEVRLIPIININFLSSLIFTAFFAFINVLNQRKNYSSTLVDRNEFFKIISYIIPIILIYTVYNSFRLEISTYWNQLFNDSLVTIQGEVEQNYNNFDLLKFKSIWLICYSLLFFSILSFVNIKKIKSQQLAFVNLGLNVLVVFIFLTQGLYYLSELRESYLQQTLSQYYARGMFNVEIRYIALLFVAVMLYSTFIYIKQVFLEVDFKIAYDIFLYTTIIWIASSELISWLDIYGSTQSYKLGISILWGVYSLLIISLGIWKRKKYLRIGAIVLFALTLLKLFVYDISDLDTIRKTIVFVLLGILLLIISFLYNKYKHIISGELTE
jgi:uncharacterized membrane protein